ncbi:ATP-binding protein [Streptomyces bacillaris]|uniref:ATP-binding protein n=1 Tax=Streptomyces TaxID=1883 RepID=UPI000D6F1003|nr:MULTISPECIES: ATP-binding protein [unclassified Streptomyces]NGO87405.1 ATP-binding protein [Streptomyces sp. 196(2019)]PWS40770.1 ATP-binding protein [Streptomyces sp. ZEA17I]
MNEATQPPYLRTNFYCRDRSSVPVVRKFTRKALIEWGCEERAYDMLLCVTELATNALRHGVPPGRGFRVRISLERREASLRIELHDSGDGEVRMADELPGVEEEGGRGLLLVSALADKWGVAERNPGKIVWCEFTLG